MHLQHPDVTYLFATKKAKKACGIKTCYGYRMNMNIGNVRYQSCAHS